MKSVKFLAVILFIVMVISSCSKKESVTSITSPNGNIEVDFILSNNGEPGYVVRHKGDIIVDSSYFGFDFKDQSSLKNNFKLISSETSETKEEWEMPWGEQRMVTNHHNTLKINLQEG